MTVRLRWLVPSVALAAGLGGCVVAPPVGEVVYEPPAVAVEPPTYAFHWGIFPHYEVDHHYVIDDEHVHIRDRHYYPGWEASHRYVRNDRGRHRGWFRHDD